MSNLKVFDAFDSYDLQSASEEKALADSLQQGVLKLAQGVNVLRFFPPLKGQKSPFYVTHNHFIKLPFKDEVKSHNCPKLMNKERCATCELVQQYLADQRKVIQDLGNEIKAKLRAYAVVIDRNAPEMGPRVFAMGYGIWRDLVDIRENPLSGGDFCNPHKGFDIVITKSGDSKKTKYKVECARESTPLGTPEEVGEWLEMLPAMATFTAVPSYQDTVDILNSMGAAAALTSATPVAVPGAAKANRLPVSRTKAPAVSAPATRNASRTIQDAVEDSEDDFDPDADLGCTDC